MRLALIPPFCMAGYMTQTDYQLVLPECFRDEGYTRTVYSLDRKEACWITLDNGAAEGKAWHPQALMAIGREFKVSEVVIPDELGDMEITLDMLEWFEDETTLEDRQEFDYMGVLQGANMSQLMQCAEVFLEKPYVTCLGIPRHLLDTLGDKHARIVVATELHNRFPKDDYAVDIHFLGTNPTWYSEAKTLQAACPWARGIDTSLPFVGSYYGIVIDDTDAPIVGRPEGYFEQPAPTFGQAIIDQNIMILKGWLRG
jgi:hypothetical protein